MTKNISIYEMRQKMSKEKISEMPFKKIYPLLVSKALKKGRSEEEVQKIVTWLLGYSDTDIKRMLIDDTSYGDFFKKAPCLNPRRKLIKGMICGVRLEEIVDPLMQEIRYLDKLIDELAKGKTLDKIMR